MGRHTPRGTRGRFRIIAALTPMAVLLSACVSTPGSEAADDLKLPVAVGLSRNQDGLAQFVAASADPTGSSFLASMSADQVKTTYGANQNSASAALQTLQQAGFVGSIDATGSIISGQMSVKDVESFFDTDMRVVSDGGTQVVRPAAPVQVPIPLAAYATNVAGFTRSVPSATQASNPPTRSEQPPCPPPIQLTTKLRNYYGLNGIYAAGNSGQGITLAMLEVDQLSQPAIQLFEKCFDVQIPPVTNTVVADANPAVFGDEAEESTLDIVAAGLVAPDLAAIQTYQFDPYTSMLFALNDAVGASFQPNGPQILSTSISFCEDDLTQSEITMMEWILAAGAATGLTSVASAGDNGSSGCFPSTTDQKNQYPGTSTYVTGLGGTQFATLNGALSEVVWNNSPSQKQAGGGATVSRLPRPSYQGNISGPSNRITPDIALVAEPADFGPIPVCNNDGSCTMQVVGGTSATAPGYAAAIATLLQALRKSNGEQLKLGSMNPMLYDLAGSPSAPTVFHDITQGTNDLYGVGCCTAVPGYDSASGWGSVDFGTLLQSYQSAAPRG